MVDLAGLTPAELQWIDDQLVRARAFVARYANATELTLETLDSAWGIWLATSETDTERVNEAINAVGMAFGQALAEATPLRWVIAQDEHGADLALHAFPGRGDVLIHPANLVAKRWQSRQSPFLASLYAQIVADVERIGSSQSVSVPKKAWWKLW